MIKVKGSQKALRLSLNTHNKITKHSITDMSVKTLGDSLSGFDSCIVKITEDKRVIYSANLIVNTLYDEIVQWNKEHLSSENPEEEDHLMLAIEHYYHTIECLTVNKGIEFTELDIKTL